MFVYEPQPLKEGESKHTISVFVADEAGLINRVAGVFARRGEAGRGGEGRGAGEWGGVGHRCGGGGRAADGTDGPSWWQLAVGRHWCGGWGRGVVDAGTCVCGTPYAPCSHA